MDNFLVIQSARSFQKWALSNQTSDVLWCFLFFWLPWWYSLWYQQKKEKSSIVKIWKTFQGRWRNTKRESSLPKNITTAIYTALEFLPLIITTGFIGLLLDTVTLLECPLIIPSITTDFAVNCITSIQLLRNLINVMIVDGWTNVTCPWTTHSLTVLRDKDCWQ